MSNSRLCRHCRSLTGRRRVYLNRHHISHQSWIEKVRLDLFFALFGFHVPFRLQLTLPFALFLQHARLTFHVTFCPRCLQCDSCDWCMIFYYFHYFCITIEIYSARYYTSFAIYFSHFICYWDLFGTYDHHALFILLLSLLTLFVTCWRFPLTGNYRHQTIRCTKNPIYIFPEKE